MRFGGTSLCLVLLTLVAAPACSDDDGEVIAELQNDNKELQDANQELQEANTVLADEAAELRAALEPIEQKLSRTSVRLAASRHCSEEVRKTLLALADDVAALEGEAPPDTDMISADACKDAMATLALDRLRRSMANVRTFFSDVEDGTVRITGGGDGGGGNCHSSYPDFCIPPPPPDLDCSQVSGSYFTVSGTDPHGFDGYDNDGVGCES